MAGTGLLAFAHGGNDAQKCMGVIALALVLSGRLSSFAVPPWVIVVSAATLVLGGLTGGWGIARTLGYGIYRLEPLHAAGAQAGAAGVVYGAALLGGPVSTTQVVASADHRRRAPRSGPGACAGTPARDGPGVADHHPRRGRGGPCRLPAARGPGRPPC